MPLTNNDNKKYVYFSVLISLVLILLVIGLAEIVLRVSHYKIKHYWGLSYEQRNEPVVNSSDPVLGWRPMPGRYIIPSYAPMDRMTPYTIWPDGSRATGSSYDMTTYTIWPDESRATGPSYDQRPAKVIITGCSVGQGWAISDDETFAWRLQEKHKGIRFANISVVGYSTYQSLLFLEDYLKRNHAEPSVIMNVFIPHDEERNVGDMNWLINISHQTRRLRVDLPYCLLNKNDSLKCFEPEHYPRWPLDKSSYLVNAIKDSYLLVMAAKRTSRKTAVTQKILERMNDLSRKYGAQFVVVNLGQSEVWQKYSTFLDRENIKWINCYDERLVDKAYQVPYDGHPNGKMNSIIAGCIEAGLKKELSALKDVP